MRRIIIAIVIIAIVVVGGYFLFQRSQSDPDGTVDSAATADVNTISIDTGATSVSAEGQIIPSRFANLSFLTSGEIVEIFVEEDQDVNAGDPIVRLDTADQELALQQAIAGLVQADANLDVANAGFQAAEAGLAAADVNVLAAEAALALAQAEPTVEQIALSEAAIGVAEAGISAAAGSQSLTLEGPADSEIKAAEAQLLAAEAAQKPLQNALGLAERFNAGEDTIADIALQYNAATANLQAAQAALDDLAAGATNSQRVAAGNAVEAARAQRGSAQAQLDLLLAGPKQEQIAIAEVGVQRALAARDEAAIGLEQAQTTVAQAEAAVVQAENLVEAAQESLDQRTLLAPFAGSIATFNNDLGEVAAPGVPVVTVVDFSNWLVETTDLTELDVVAISLGRPVEVVVDALPNDTIQGVVTDIGRVSDLTRGDVTYQVQITLADTENLPLRWGMTTAVEIETGASE